MIKKVKKIVRRFSHTNGIHEYGKFYNDFFSLEEKIAEKELEMIADLEYHKAKSEKKIAKRNARIEKFNAKIEKLKGVIESIGLRYTSLSEKVDLAKKNNAELLNVMKALKKLGNDDVAPTQNEKVEDTLITEDKEVK